MKSPLEPFLPINFSETYLKQGGNLSQHRAAEAGYRLAEVWRQGLTGPSLVREPDAEPASLNEDDDLEESGEPPATESTSATSPAEPAVLTHWLNMNSNVRHNSQCKNFETTKNGRLCSPDEGRPCGICGG